MAEIVGKVQDALSSVKDRLPAFKPATEFFDHRQLSRPTSVNEASQRITYNTRYFSGNYLIIIIILIVYALLTNPLLLIAIGLFAGGFTAINRFAPESVDVGGRTVTQKHMYTALFAVGFVLLFLAGPISVFFWLVASSTIIILGHATLMETGLESEYQNIESAA